MELANAMMSGVWTERSKYEEAERVYQEHLAKTSGAHGDASSTKQDTSAGGGSVAQLIRNARQKILDSMNSLQTHRVPSSDVPTAVVKELQDENATLKQQIAEMTKMMAALESRLSAVESKCGVDKPPAYTATKPAAAADDDEDDDDDDDLFDSDEEEDAVAAKIKAERIAAYAAKKSKKAAVIAKSNIIFDVKPWDDETDMAELERCVRSVETDGLLWGTSKLVKIAFGIQKLQITCVVEDDKVGTDFLEESITAFEDYVQSVDIAAFNKI